MNTKIRPIWFLTIAILAALLIAPSYRAIVPANANSLKPIALKLDSPSAPMVYPINPGYCVPDVDGANDLPGQKDLSRLCMDITTNTSVIEIEWGWDDIGSSGSNTMDASVFFDSDGDGFANYGIFVTTTGNPATLLNTRFATCPADDSATQCGGAVEVIPLPAGLTCSVNSPVANDPFPAGDFYPNDAVGYCYVPRSIFTAPPPVTTLLNVCTRSSAALTSDRSDCVGVEGGGFIQIEKFENPPAGITWDFTVNNGTSNVCLPGPTITPVAGYGAKLCSLQAGTYSVAETDYLTNPEYTLVAWSCSTLAGSVGTSNGTNGTTGLVVASGTNINCEFDNAIPTAVTIAFIEAAPSPFAVDLAWSSDSEVDVLGYNVYRSIVAASIGSKINTVMIPAQKKGQSTGATYQFVDNNPIYGLTNYYQVQVVYMSGAYGWSDQVSAYLAGFVKYLPFVRR